MANKISSFENSSGLPGWRDSSNYDALLLADRSAFAWEWLRRHEPYRRAWALREHRDATSLSFGLVRFEDPLLAVPIARPIWSADVDPSVIPAKIHSVHAATSDRIDLLDLRHLLTLSVDTHEIEHLLFSDGAHPLRIDIIEGTLIGCPAMLRYIIEGIDTLKGPLSSIERLIHLSKTGSLYQSRSRDSKMPKHWISELRVADALIGGADQQDIARTLYGDLVPSQQWRTANSAYRTRIQRLTRAARRCLASPLDPSWFALE